MKKILILCLILPFQISLTGQQSISNLGFGYSMVYLNLSEFEDMLVKINTNNQNLTKTFSTDNSFQGFNIFWAIRNKKSITTLQYSRLNNTYKADGKIPVISPNTTSYNITSFHNLFSFQYDYRILKFIGIGAELGYHYSGFKNKYKDLFFGEANSVVDKQGGGFYGANVMLIIPLGSSISFDIQPFYIQSFRKIDMDNLPAIYLGQNHSTATKTSVGGYGVHFKFGLKF
ncbi:MAG: hypothetical protein HOP11_14810 [Saprospiraceae bacterium]|nr:hypothetical protein [Saprospiraceae bacterium]